MKNVHTKIYRYLIGSCLLCLFCGCKQTNEIHTWRANACMDPIEEIPEWLKTNVETALPSDSLNVWIPTDALSTSSLIRVPRFPSIRREDEREPSPFDIHLAEPSLTYQVQGVRNEQQSFQIAVAAPKPLTGLSASLESLVSEKGDTLPAAGIRIRYVRYVPVHRSRSELTWSTRGQEVYDKGVSGTGSPDLVADPLMDMPEVDVPAYRAQPVWFTVQIPATLTPGTYSGRLKVHTDQYSDVSLKVAIRVLPPVLPDPAQYKFFLDLWFNPNAIAVANNLEPWSEEHWKQIETYMDDLASRGVKTITTTLVPYPWKVDWLGGTKRPQTYAGYPSMVDWYRDESGNWSFGYTRFDRFVETSFRHGIDRRIEAFSLTPFDHKGGWKIYFTHQENQTPDTLFFKGPETGYKEVWQIFLRDFENHLSRKGWLDKTYLSFDESPRDVMDAILDIVSGSTPGFLKRFFIAGRLDTEALAGAHSVFYTFLPEQLTPDDPVARILEKRREDPAKNSTFYLCGDPAHPNTLTFSPASEIRMIPWLAAYYGLDGYLRWAYNSWSDKDPYNHPVFNFIQGDDYYIYPGKEGPVSSIRWELLKEGIEDYELLRLLDSPRSTEAVEQAVRHRDGRTKPVTDFEKARALLLEEPDTASAR